MSASRLKLNCFVLDDGETHDPQEAFLVEIDSTQTVIALREAIKAKHDGLARVEAHRLRLWKASFVIPSESRIKKTFGSITLADADSLLPTDELSEHFVNLSPKCIHVFIKTRSVPG